MTVGGVSLAQYTHGNIRNDLIVVGYSSMFYGTPGAFTTARSMVIGSIHTAVRGAVIALYAGQPHKTITESWSGSGTLVEDSNAQNFSGNQDAVECSVATSASSTTARVTFTASAAAQHCRA